jgi:hypothetical protein
LSANEAFCFSKLNEELHSAMDIDGNSLLLMTQKYEWRELERDQSCVTIGSEI